MFSTSLAFFKNPGTFGPAPASFLAAGSFQSFGTATNNNIASINYDGTINTSINFGFGFSDTTNVVVRDPSTGKIYVGGAFQSYNGSSASGVQYNRIIRLNSDGTVDNTFNTSGGAGGQVFAIALDSAGKIYVGGQFANFGDTLGISGIIRLNNDGSIDSGFDATTGFSANTQVRTIVVDSADKIYVGGNFSTYKGVAANRIIKLNGDGSKDTSFDNSTGFSGTTVLSIVLDSGGKLYVSGQFTSYKGVFANGIIKLNTDGSKDTSFDNTTGFSAASVNQVILDSSGKLYVVGQFTSYKGVAANRIIKLNTDGSKDTSFDNTTGFSAATSAIVITSDNKIYVTGSFATYKGEVARGIARLNTDGSRDTSFNISNEFNGGATLNTMLLLPGDAILVGGLFFAYNPADKFLIKLNTDGTKNNSLNIGGTGGFPSVLNNAIYAIAKDSSGALYVGGLFTSYNGVTTNRIMKFNPDGTRDNSFNIGTGFNNTVRCIAIDSAGKIYVGGDFITYNSVGNNRIIRLNSDGSKDTGFDNATGFNSGGVYDIKFDSAGKLYVGGSFTQYKGVAASRIIKLNTDGSKDTSFINATAFNGTVNQIALDSAGKIYAVGAFTSYLGVTNSRIIKLNTDGSKDTSFDNTIGLSQTTNAVLIDGDGKIYVGGAFTNYKNLPNNRIMRLNPDGSKDEGFDNGGTGSGFLFGSVVSMALLNTNKLIVGTGSAGTQSYRGTPTSTVTILNTDGTIDTGFNPVPGLSLGTLSLVYSVIPL